MNWPAMRSLEQALHALHDRRELGVDDLQTPLRVAAIRMITSEQLQMAVNRIQRRSDFMCERSSHLADRREPFSMRETLLRADQIPVSGAQLSSREMNFLDELVVQTA